MDFDRFITEISLKKDIPEGSYLKNLPVVRFLERSPIAFRKSVTFFCGENGSGKSTLTEALAVAFGFNPEGGTLNYCFETNPTHSSLWEYLRLSKLLRPKDGYFLRAESFYNAASYLEELDGIAAPAPKVLASYGGISLHKMSHGEGFLKLIHERFSGSGLYILDEPEAALSPMKIMSLICEIERLVKLGSQFIIATHSPILMAYPGAEVLQIDESGVRAVDYRETEHFKVTAGFMRNPERYMGMILEG